MKNLKHFITACIVCIVTVSFGQESSKLENSVLWKIEHPNLEKPSYLFGTLHLMCEDDFLMPEKVLKSLESIDDLVLEVNLSDPKEMQDLQKEMTSASKISEDLTKEQFAKLDTFIQKIMGVPLQNFDAYGISTLYSMMASKMLPCTKIKAMETELVKIATQNNTNIVALEKVSEQFSYIKKAYSPLESYRLIFLFEEYKKDFNNAIESYKKENITEAVRLIAQEKYMNSNSKQYMLSLRNANWVNKMPEMMKEKSNLFAVGTAHLTGKKGLIQLLRQKGYTVTPVL
ncbi:TraB/GumN family protein [Echinicola marina]|uniref:TraB/GumN family protein n=1 Tax=Echinicola marina TaxID=2859768 RepID=UPI001CF66A73|nr:TraB/GumN family protein [Echinicola marina]UCS92710.1 TraB/GumN family protein [Echinicola marina]